MQLNVVCKIPEKSGYSKKMEGVCSAVAETIGVFIYGVNRKKRLGICFTNITQVFFSA